MAGAVFLLNIPFGCWRANLSRFSLSWLLAIHVPVALAIAIRVLAGLDWQFITLPLFAGAFFFGQLLGGKITHHLWTPGRPAPSEHGNIAGSQWEG